VKSLLPEIVELIVRTAFPEFVIVVLSVEVVFTVTTPKLSASGVTPISGPVPVPDSWASHSSLERTMPP
jgi:hypothetical protein